MPKPVNCCVPGCFKNFRNSPDLHYYKIPKDQTIRKEYVRIIRNQTLVNKELINLNISVMEGEGTIA